MPIRRQLRGCYDYLSWPCSSGSPLCFLERIEDLGIFESLRITGDHFAQLGILFGNAVNDCPYGPGIQADQCIRQFLAQLLWKRGESFLSQCGDRISREGPGDLSVLVTHAELTGHDVKDFPSPERLT